MDNPIPKNLMRIFKTFVIIVVTGLSQTIGADDSIGELGRYFDLGISPGIGGFLYPQLVKGGYYINRKPYDLTWYGAHFHCSGDCEFFIPRLKKLGIGLGGAFMMSPNPIGTDVDRTVTVDRKKSSFGGYGGVSLSCRVDDKVRVGMLAGYGGAGLADNGKGFGGTGVVLSSYGRMYLPFKRIVLGMGIRLLAGFFTNPSKETVRGESGSYCALMVEPSVEWVHHY